MSKTLTLNENKQIELITKRDEVLARFKSLVKMINEAGADLANANAELARFDERMKIQEEQKQ